MPHVENLGVVQLPLLDCVVLSAMTPLNSVQPWLGSPTPHFAEGSKASSTNMMPSTEEQTETAPIS